jgi:hypothetical protein
MLKLLFGLVLFCGLALAVAFVPLRGRTVLERWNAAPSAAAFAERSWREAKVALGLEKEPPRPARASSQQPPRGARPAPPRAREPVEHHSAEDRAAVDRIVAESARR